MEIARNNAHQLAVARGKIANILQVKGDRDEALRIYREEVLPAFERLRDVRQKALAMGKIADILQAKGELDEALRIRREDELPVYQQLGDMRAWAITQGKIADILQAKGELDEARRIRHEAGLRPIGKFGRDLDNFQTPVKLPEHNLNIDENRFLGLLAGSASLNKQEKRRIIEAIDKITQQQVDELIRILEEEKQKFSDLDMHHEEDLKINESKSAQYWAELEIEMTAEKQPPEERA